MPTPMVTLRAMDPTESASWQGRAVEVYAREAAVSTGRPLGELLLENRDELRTLLAAEPTWLFVVVDDDGLDVGILWLGPHPRRPAAAFVYDVEIAEAHRGRGLGRAAMTAGEEVVAAAGMTAIGLSVRARNAAARSLYDALGYRVVTLQMVKDLPVR